MGCQLGAAERRRSKTIVPTKKCSLAAGSEARSSRIGKGSSMPCPSARDTPNGGCAFRMHDRAWLSPPLSQPGSGREGPAERPNRRTAQEGPQDVRACNPLAKIWSRRVAAGRPGTFPSTPCRSVDQKHGRGGAAFPTYRVVAGGLELADANRVAHRIHTAQRKSQPVFHHYAGGALTLLPAMRPPNGSRRSSSPATPAR